jgi:hypothetical protein
MSMVRSQKFIGEVLEVTAENALYKMAIYIFENSGYYGS